MDGWEGGKGGMCAAEVSTRPMTRDVCIYKHTATAHAAQMVPLADLGKGFGQGARADMCAAEVLNGPKETHACIFARARMGLCRGRCPRQCATRTRKTMHGATTLAASNTARMAFSLSPLLQAQSSTTGDQAPIPARLEA